MCKRIHKLAIGLFAVEVFGALSGVTYAETHIVPDQYLTIQAAIDAAQHWDTVLVRNGTYTGPGNKNLNFDGKSITVRSEYGPDNCTIDCENDGRGFHFFGHLEGPMSVVEGFTIINGGGVHYGGAIFCENFASPTIRNCVMKDGNAISGGGAIRCDYQSRARISNCTITNNTAGQGGGVHVVRIRDVDIANCVIAGNVGGVSEHIRRPK